MRFDRIDAGALSGGLSDVFISTRKSMDRASLFCHTENLFNLQRRAMMSLEAHLAELAEKHRVLERKIEEEEARLGSDDLEIRRLKQEKLKLKDQIVRLRSETRH